MRPWNEPGIPSRSEPEGHRFPLKPQPAIILPAPEPVAIEPPAQEPAPIPTPKRGPGRPKKVVP